MDNEIIDLGEWYVPKGWSDLTLGQFQQMQEELGDGNAFDIRKVLHIFCGKSQEEVDALPMSVAEELLSQLVWLHTELPKMEPTNRITVKGEEYMINTEEEMRTGEFIQVDSILKSNPKDYASILAVLCRKKGERFDSDYEARLFNERREMFLGVPMLEGMACMSFFLQCWRVSELATKLYMEALRELSSTRRHIRSSASLGLLQKFFLMRQAKTLWRSIVSSSPTSATSSYGSHTGLRRLKWRKRRTSSRRIYERPRGTKKKTLSDMFR